jgi:hypothetical protein
MKISRLLPLAAAISLMFGCGGGGGSSAVGGSGKIVDGYVSGAVVVCDSNNNGVKDGAEVSTTTNATGDFTFTPACTDPLFSTGGTNVDTGLPFVGVLKAPAGSTMVTPLTTLVSSGMTNEQVVAALGLPAGTNVTTTDPIAAGNEDLRKKTLVVQQIMQKTTETLSSIAGVNISSDASAAEKAKVNAIFQDVAAAVTSAIKTNITAAVPVPLIPLNSTTVNSTVVSASVSAAVTAVKASTNPVVVAANNDIKLLDPASVATVASTAITTQAQNIALATDAASIVAQATEQQADSSVAENVAQVENYLTTASSSAADITAQLTTYAAQFEVLASNPTAAEASTAQNALNAAATTAATAINNAGGNVTAPVFDTAFHDYLAVNSVTVGNSTATLATFASPGITITGNLSTALNVSFGFVVDGTVVANGATKIVKVAAEVRDLSTGTGKRLLQVMIDQVALTQTGTSLTATIPAGAKAHIYAVNSEGTSLTAARENLSSNLVTVSSNTVNLNLGDLLGSLTTSQQEQINPALEARGTFDAKVVISGIEVREDTVDLKELETVVVSNAGNAEISLSGPGAKGKVIRN